MNWAVLTSFNDILELAEDNMQTVDINNYGLITWD